MVEKKSVDEPMVKVKLTDLAFTPEGQPLSGKSFVRFPVSRMPEDPESKVYGPGDVVALPAKLARDLVSMGRATKV